MDEQATFQTIQASGDSNFQEMRMAAGPAVVSLRTVSRGAAGQESSAPTGGEALSYASGRAGR